MLLLPIYIMVVPPQPRHPHFAAYIRHFARKLDSRLDGSITAQTVPSTTTQISLFHFCRMYHAKRNFISKVALSLKSHLHFWSKLHSRPHESHFFHIFRDLLVWPKCTPCKNCTHSRVLASLSFRPSPNRASLSRFSLIFDLQFLFHHDAHLKRVSLSRFSIIFDLHLSLHHNFHLKRALPPHYAAQPRSLLWLHHTFI